MTHQGHGRLGGHYFHTGCPSIHPSVTKMKMPYNANIGPPENKTHATTNIMCADNDHLLAVAWWVTVLTFQSNQEKASNTLSSNEEQVTSKLDSFASSSNWNASIFTANEDISCLNLSKTGDLAIGTFEGTISLYPQIMNPDCAMKFSSAHGRKVIWSLSFSDSHLACSDKDGKVEVYNLRDFSEVYSYKHDKIVAQVIITNKVLISVGNDFEMRIVNVKNWKLISQIKRKANSHRQIAIFSNNLLTVGDFDTIQQYKVDDNCHLFRQMDVKGHNIFSILPVHNGEESLFWVGTAKGCLLKIDINLNSIEKKYQLNPEFWISQIEKLQDWIVLEILNKKSPFYLSVVAFRAASLEKDNGVESEFRQIVPFGKITSNLVARGEHLFYCCGEYLKKIHVKEIQQSPPKKKFELHADMESKINSQMENRSNSTGSNSSGTSLSSFFRKMAGK